MSEAVTAEHLTGERKAAILVVLLGEQAAGSLMRNLSQREVARIAREVAELGPIPPEVAQTVLEEYYLSALETPTDHGGPDKARQLLSQAHIEEELVDKLIAGRDAGNDVLGPLLEAPPEVLATALQDEHPQTTALVLLHLPPRRAAQLLTSLPEAARGETVLRMSTLRQVSGEILGEVATSLHRRLIDARRSRGDGGGVARTASVLEKMSRSDCKRLLDELEPDHPEEVEVLRGELYTFDSLLGADDRGMQEMLRQLDTSKIALALTGADEKLAERFLSNLSERASGMLREEMEFVGTPNELDQAAARKEILDLALKLEADGALVFSEPEGDGADGNE